jgi:hypothetical protein
MGFSMKSLFIWYLPLDDRKTLLLTFSTFKELLDLKMNKFREHGSFFIRIQQDKVEHQEVKEMKTWAHHVCQAPGRVV